MARHIPSNIRTAINDPKLANTSQLEAALEFVDAIEPSTYAVIADEYDRRGGEYDFIGHTDYVAPSYY